MKSPSTNIFRTIKDMNNRTINPKYYFISGTIGSKSFLEYYKYLKGIGIKYISFSRRLDFPKNQVEGFVEDAECFFHCFRNPQAFDIPENKPQTLISNSDYSYLPVQKKQKRIYDFMYSTAWFDWGKTDAKNEKFFVEFAREFCLSGYLTASVVGRESFIQDYPELDHPNITFHGILPKPDIYEEMGRAKCFFIPSTIDASPRVISEALLCDTPIVVNARIYGGWKYVNESTGRFADCTNYDNCVDAFTAIKEAGEGSYSCREYFLDLYGPEKTGKRAANFVRENTILDIPKSVKGIQI